MKAPSWPFRIARIVCAFIACQAFAACLCGRDANGWFRGDPTLQDELAESLVAFEATDDESRRAGASDKSHDRFKGEWALVTHQMVALGLAQICLARPDERTHFVPVMTRAAIKSFLPEMRDFGTRAWHGEDALASLDSSHGHAYLSYPALAVGMARLLDPDFPKEVASRHDALIRAYERRLLGSKTGLIETYPGEAYPTDVAAVAGAIAVHGRATGVDHTKVLQHWASNVRRVQIDPRSGLVFQRMDAASGKPHDAPRGSGTGLAAYFAGFADRSVAQALAKGLFAHEASWSGFGAIREYAAGYTGHGDIDSGPVVLGVSVSATGFALAPARAWGKHDKFVRIYRTTDLFGMPNSVGGRRTFSSGGPIGNALLLAFLTSGPELAS
ncbi:MAG: hypothetical protein U0174_13860 [Polyangiaceae bacterium]